MCSLKTPNFIMLLKSRYTEKLPQNQQTHMTVKQRSKSGDRARSISLRQEQNYTTVSRCFKTVLDQNLLSIERVQRTHTSALICIHFLPKLMIHSCKWKGQEHPRCITEQEHAATHQYRNSEAITE